MTLNAQAIRQKMEEISSFIREAEDSARTGTIIDITRLEGEIAQLCEGIAKLPKAQSLEIHPLMADMIGALERLELVLKDYKS
jgi:hypothetical protein